MARRVLMGQKGGQSGFFVSKPGVDVVTASDDDLLIATTLESLQIVASGVIANPSASQTISFIDLGYRPIVLLSCNRGVGNITYNSNSSITVVVGTTQSLIDAYWLGSTRPTLSSQLRWAVTNVPI